MELRHQKLLDAPVDLVWRNFTDLHRVGRCFPGARVTHVEGDAFAGLITSRLGPLTLTFDGTGEVTQRDESARRTAIRAEGQQRRGPGSARLQVQVRLVEEGPGQTRAQMVTDLALRALPTHLGEGMAQRASDALVDRFLTGMGREAPCEDDAPQDQPLDIGRDVLLGMMKSYGSSVGRLFGRR